MPALAGDDNAVVATRKDDTAEADLRMAERRSEMLFEAHSSSSLVVNRRRIEAPLSTEVRESDGTAEKAKVLAHKHAPINTVAR
mmetsp:Transcript_3485/g.6366  ORF Transcript_3485/g.6366 Transcript_3485/m.6366 type:complete len:84 (-) Transcript_3485:114-365(-)